MSQTNLDAETARSDQFCLAEYHEATNAYFKGVDIGYTSVKSYVTINGLFAALVGALADPKGPLPASLAEVVKFIPWFAVAISLSLMIALPHYFRHLNNCSDRAAELEATFDGALFSRLKKISDSRSSFNTGLGLLLMVGAIAGFWVYFGLKSLFPGVDFWHFVTSLHK
jgi:hypothetical protein